MKRLSKHVRQVLAGTLSYDELDSEGEQAIVRAEWNRRIEEAVAGLRLDEEFKAAGREYVELDEYGQVVIRRPEGQTVVAGKNS